MTNQMMRGTGMLLSGRQWVARASLLAVLAGGLTACGGAQAPQTSQAPQPAPTSSELVQATVVSSPATTASASEGTPASGATPTAGATPATAASVERLAKACAAYEAWLNAPEVSEALAKSALWPEVIAQGELAAAGKPVDTGAMRRDLEEMAKVGKTLRLGETEGDHAPLQLSGRAMGLTSRLAGGLGNGTLDAAAAGAAVAEAKAAIADYERDAAARQAECA